MHLAARRQRPQNLEMAGRQARDPEQAQPRREFQQRRLLTQPRTGLRPPLGGPGERDPVAQPPPQRRLPRLADRQQLPGGVGVAPVGPEAEHLRTVQRVAVEHLRQVAHDRQTPLARERIAAPVPGGGPTAAQVIGQRCQPGLAERLVDDLQQRPDRTLRQPRVGLGIDPGGDGDGVGEQPVRGGELDVGTDAVAAAGRGAEHARHPLGQPPLHPARRHGDEIGSERVLGRVREQLGEGIGEHIGTRGTVDVQHGRSGYPPSPSPRPCRRGGDKVVSLHLHSHCCWFTLRSAFRSHLMEITFDITIPSTRLTGVSAAACGRWTDGSNGMSWTGSHFNGGLAADVQALAETRVR